MLPYDGSSCVPNSTGLRASLCIVVLRMAVTRGQLLRCCIRLIHSHPLTLGLLLPKLHSLPDRPIHCDLTRFWGVTWVGSAIVRRATYIAGILQGADDRALSWIIVSRNAHHYYRVVHRRLRSGTSLEPPRLARSSLVNGSFAWRAQRRLRSPPMHQALLSMYYPPPPLYR